MQPDHLCTGATCAVHYASTCRLLWRDDVGGYISSGIAAYDERGELLTCFQDVSCDHRMVEELVDKLNRGQAALIHLEDIVLDFLNT